MPNLKENYERFFHAGVVIAKALYPLLLTITSKSRLSLHPFWMLGIRGWIIVGTHHLVVRAAKELKPSLDCYGIVYLRVSPFNPVSSRNIPIPG
jgi:hypothetical protein